MNEDVNDPLYVIQSIEEAHIHRSGMVGRALRWLDERLPILLRPHVPHGRRSVEHLLIERKADFIQAWICTSLPETFVRAFLELIEGTFVWPNGRFVPDDRCRLVFLPQFEEEFPLAMLQLGLREAFQCEVDLEELEAFWIDDTRTLGNLAALVYERTKWEN